MFDPSLGRWMTLDPIAYQAGDENLYRYEANAPINFIDPDGLQIRPNVRIPHITMPESNAPTREELIQQNKDTAKNLKPNSGGVGRRYFHFQNVTLTYCLEGSEIDIFNKLKPVGTSIYNDMKKFKHFNENNIATAMDPFVIGGVTYTGFLNNGNDGYMAGLVSGDGPDSRSFVRLDYDDDNWEIKATTLGNHLLVGTRTWNVHLLVNGNKATITIYTTATEKRLNNRVDAGFELGDKGPNGTVTVWKTYLENVAKAHKEYNPTITVGKPVSKFLDPLPLFNGLPGGTKLPR